MDSQTGTLRADRPAGAGRPSRTSGGTGTDLTFEGQPGHAWFARAPRSNLPRRAESLPAIRVAEQFLARQDKAFGKRAVRIPTDAFVSIASRALPAPAPVLKLAGPARSEAAAAVASARSSVRAPEPVKQSPLRTIFFLLVFLTTIALAYWSGRMRGYQNVIVVPAPWSDSSTVT